MSKKNRRQSIKQEKRQGEVKAREASAPIVIRFVAYLIDWLLGLLVSAFPLVIIIGSVTGSTDVSDSLLSISFPWNIIGGLLAILFGFGYYVLIPWKVWKGQTPGKRMLNIVILTEKYKEVTFKALVMRQFVGLFILEGFLISSSRYLRDIILVITGSEVLVQYLYYAAIGISLVSVLMAVFTWKNQALHDRLAKTRVYPVKSINS